jgi:uncharacterized protein YqeY
MSLADRIRNDLTAALKNRETARVGTLRMLIAALKNAEISKRGTLSDDDCTAQVQKAIKVRREAIEGATQAGRDDLREKEEAELKVLEIYLPAQLGEEELVAIVVAAIEEAGAGGPGDMGKVMKVLMPKIAGKADGAVASRLVREKLAS